MKQNQDHCRQRADAKNNNKEQVRTVIYSKVKFMEAVEGGGGRGRAGTSVRYIDTGLTKKNLLCITLRNASFGSVCFAAKSVRRQGKKVTSDDFGNQPKRRVTEKLL